MNTNILPRWAYLALALACVAMGLWASYITLEYFEHGAKALETDAALQALAVGAALMFVASEMAAFALASLLTERQLWAKRWMLYGFAGAVLALEVCTIVAVQLALTSGADLAQSTVQVQEADLRKRIAALEAGAAEKLATAERQRATAKNAYELRLSAKSSEQATAEQAKTAALYDELAKVQAQKRPTMIGLMGEKYALAYAIARGILVSLGGLVFFGTAGALLRAARGGTLSVDAQLLALLTELRDRPGAMPIRMAMQAQDTPAPVLAAPVAPAQTVAPAAPAPALASFKPAGTVAPKGAPAGFTYSSKTALAGAGALAAMSVAPMTHAAAPAVPAVPALSAVPAGVLAQGHHAGDSGVLVQGHRADDVGVPAQGHQVGDVVVPAQVQTKQRRRTAVPDGNKIDTGTTGKSAGRYKRVRAGVLAGTITPSVRGIQRKEGGGTEVVTRYLQALEKEGVTVRKGRGWTLKSGAQ